MNEYDMIPTGNPELDATLSQLDNEINAINDFILPDEMVVSAVQTACDFFGIPEVPIINAQGTCVWPNETDTYDDDVFGFNRQELMQIGISGEDSLTLIYTHECAHRTLQGAYNDPWEEELACDFFAGVHAGIKGMDLDNFEASLGSTPGGDTHPNGALRADFIEYGKNVAEELQARGIEVNYQNCLDKLNQHIEDKGGLIAEYRARFDPNAPAVGLLDESQVSIHGEAKGATQADINYYEHQARISSGSEQQHWLDRAKWARDHIGS